MSVKKYCYCENNCKYETLDKEEIYAAITQAVNEGTIGDCDTGFVSTIKTINGQPLRFFVGTQAEYDALSDKNNLFAIITNDTTKEGIFAALEEMREIGENCEKKYIVLCEDFKELEDWKNSLTLATETTDGFMSAQDKQNLLKVLPFETLKTTNNNINWNNHTFSTGTGWYCGTITTGDGHFAVPLFYMDSGSLIIPTCFPFFVIKDTQDNKIKVYRHIFSTENGLYLGYEFLSTAVLSLKKIKYKETE